MRLVLFLGALVSPGCNADSGGEGGAEAGEGVGGSSGGSAGSGGASATSGGRDGNGSTGGDGSGGVSTSGGGSDDSGGSAGSGSAGEGSAGSAGSDGGGGANESCDASAVHVFEDVERGVKAGFFFGSPFPEGAGAWALYGDGTGEVEITDTAEVRESGSGSNAARCFGGGFSGWGGGCIIGFTPRLDLSQSTVDGFQFWARASSSITIRVNFSDRTSSPLGDLCTATGPQCVEGCCYDHYGFLVDLGPSWTLHRIAFDDLWREDGNGPGVPFDPSWINEIDFRVPLDTDFQVDIDDVAFVECN